MLDLAPAVRFCMLFSVACNLVHAQPAPNQWPACCDNIDFAISQLDTTLYADSKLSTETLFAEGPARKVSLEDEAQQRGGIIGVIERIGRRLDQVNQDERAAGREPITQVFMGEGGTITPAEHAEVLRRAAAAEKEQKERCKRGEPFFGSFKVHEDFRRSLERSREELAAKRRQLEDQIAQRKREGRTHSDLSAELSQLDDPASLTNEPVRFLQVSAGPATLAIAPIVRRDGITGGPSTTEYRITMTADGYTWLFDDANSDAITRRDQWELVTRIATLTDPLFTLGAGFLTTHEGVGKEWLDGLFRGMVNACTMNSMIESDPLRNSFLFFAYDAARLFLPFPQFADAFEDLQEHQAALEDPNATFLEKLAALNGIVLTLAGTALDVLPGVPAPGQARKALQSAAEESQERLRRLDDKLKRTADVRERRAIEELANKEKEAQSSVKRLMDETDTAIAALAAPGARKDFVSPEFANKSLEDLLSDFKTTNDIARKIRISEEIGMRRAVELFPDPPPPGFVSYRHGPDRMQRRVEGNLTRDVAIESKGHRLGGREPPLEISTAGPSEYLQTRQRSTLRHRDKQPEEHVQGSPQDLSAFARARTIRLSYKVPAAQRRIDHWRDKLAQAQRNGDEGAAAFTRTRLEQNESALRELRQQQEYWSGIAVSVEKKEVELRLVVTDTDTGRAYTYRYDYAANAYRRDPR